MQAVRCLRMSLPRRRGHPEGARQSTRFARAPRSGNPGSRDVGGRGTGRATSPAEACGLLRRADRPPQDPRSRDTQTTASTSGSSSRNHPDEPTTARQLHRLKVGACEGGFEFVCGHQDAPHPSELPVRQFSPGDETLHRPDGTVQHLGRLLDGQEPGHAAPRARARRTRPCGSGSEGGSPRAPLRARTRRDRTARARGRRRMARTRHGLAARRVQSSNFASEMASSRRSPWTRARASASR